MPRGATEGTRSAQWSFSPKGAIRPRSQSASNATRKPSVGGSAWPLPLEPAKPVGPVGSQAGGDVDRERGDDFTVFDAGRMILLRRIRSRERRTDNRPPHRSVA